MTKLRKETSFSSGDSFNEGFARTSQEASTCSKVNMKRYNIDVCFFLPDVQLKRDNTETTPCL